MTEVKQRKKRKFLFNPLKRPLPYLGLMLGILLLVFQRTIRNYVSDSIGEILVNSVQEATGGEYKISYDLVRFDIISKELRISNFSIELDTTVISQEGYLAKHPNLIDVKTPLVVLKLRSIFPLIFRDKLLVSFVGAKNPEFDLIRSKQSKELKGVAKQSQTDVIQVVNSYFDALEIDSFRIESGTFSIESEDTEHAEIPNIHVSEFTTMIKNFRLDSLSPSILLQGVSATTVELEVRKQEIYLPKSNQTVYFDKLKLSSLKSSIELDSLVVLQTARDNTMSHADIGVHKLKLTGVDFEKAFNDNDLAIRSIAIEQPYITYEKAKTKAKSTPSGLYKFFHQLKIDTIDLNNGVIDIAADRSSIIEDLSFTLTNYTISKEDWSNRKLISNVRIKALQAKNITQQLPDSIHKAEIGLVSYNSSTHKMSANNVKILPISGRNSYRALKSRNINFSTYTNIGFIEAMGLQPEQILLNQPLNIDSVVVKNTSSSIFQYPLMGIKKGNNNSTKLDFNIKYFSSLNGKYKLQQYQNKQRNVTQLNGVNITVKEVNPDLLQRGILQKLNIYSSDGSFELKGIGHTLTYTSLTARGTKSLFAQGLDIKPDSTTLPYHHLNGQFQNVLVNNINIDELKKGFLHIDTIAAKSGRLEADFTRQKFENKKSLEAIAIKKASLGDMDVQFNLNTSIVNVNKLSLSTENIQIDSLKTEVKPVYSFDSLQASFEKIQLSNKSDTSLLTIGQGHFSEQDSSMVAKNISFKNRDNSLRFLLNEMKLKSINKDLLLVHNKLHVSKAILIGPLINANAQNRSTSSGGVNLDERLLSGKINEVSIDTLDVYKGSSEIALPKDRSLRVGSIEGVVNNLTIDSLTLLKEAVNNLEGFFELGRTRISGKNDTLSVSKIFLDTHTKNVWTDSIHYLNISSKRALNVESPGIAVRKIDLPLLLKNQFSIQQIASKNNVVTINLLDTVTTSKPKQELPEFTVPVSFSTAELNIQNTKLEYTTPSSPKHYLNNLRFDIEIDSIDALKAHKFNLTSMTHDARLRLYDFTLDLPDSLNSFGFDTLLISNANSEVRISNLRLTPLYSKYKYGNEAGFQADWKDLLVKNITIKKINLYELIEENKLSCQKLILDDGHLDLFKDKQLPFPSDRRIPMLQERIRNTPFPIKLDTIQVKDIDIRQTTLQSSGLREGSITFASTNGIITNVTNDSARLQNDRILKVNASSRIMGKGDLSANFAFDMLAPDGLFFFDARLGAMDAKEFNNILEATAFVKVKSGNIKSINLQATANSSYAYGNMSFLYNNLKVEAYNKKNLKTKGMGVTLKSFFANTFVVKKNNSKYRLFGRRGSMYYERDPARISLDYAAKTALSGVVSSIGARNNHKEIKRIQKEQKQKRDTELKLIKEQEKAAKKIAR